MIERQHDVPDQFVAIGHSFGARLLFAAMAQPLIYESEKAHPGKDRSPYATISGSADLAIFLNPAFEASMYTALAGLTRNEETFRETQLPVSVIISTENDKANKVMFPIGQWIGASRGEREITTIGNYKKYQTHKMFKSEESNCSGLGGAGISEVYFASGFCLQRVENEGHPNDPDIPNFKKYNPFLVVSATADVIDGHNGIGTKEFASWLLEFVTSMVSQRDQGEKTPPVAGEMSPAF
jgi:hypothetical protein